MWCRARLLCLHALTPSPPPGSGTILLEAAAERSGRACRFIAADVAAEQVAKCTANARASGLAPPAFFDVLRADARGALLSDCTVASLAC